MKKLQLSRLPIAATGTVPRASAVIDAAPAHGTAEPLPDLTHEQLRTLTNLCGLRLVR
jgi:hypothetical protein